ncbi:hypothetical protein RRG08_058663 [Elysia crispata]|uniref:Uncharacterized protein n=1 Tax=Elysia crispata TaxID=231223 RepID=A0AAE0YW77_9GAST|nr:hypothetical protein RRG08_058663 [Elysia crispata]
MFFADLCKVKKIHQCYTDSPQTIHCLVRIFVPFLRPGRGPGRFDQLLLSQSSEPRGGHLHPQEAGWCQLDHANPGPWQNQRKPSQLTVPSGPVHACSQRPQSAPSGWIKSALAQVSTSRGRSRDLPIIRTRSSRLKA